MAKMKLPELPPGIELLGPPDRPEEGVENGYPVLRVRYRVHGLRVTIGWVVGHPMGDFRHPNELNIRFDAMDHGMGYGKEDASVFEGITTGLLRALPMAHARALMRERYEQLSVADVARAIMPLPARVETDDDYLHIATAYEALCHVSLEPLQQMAQLTNQSVETWSARIRRAKAKGMLVGKGSKTDIGPDFKDRSQAIWVSMKEGRHPGGNQ